MIGGRAVPIVAPLRALASLVGRADRRIRAVPRMALRRHDDGTMDDVVVSDVLTFRAEQLDTGLLWLACYFANGERVTFNVHAERKSVLVYDVGELPGEWVDIDRGRRG